MKYDYKSDEYKIPKKSKCKYPSQSSINVNHFIDENIILNDDYKIPKKSVELLKSKINENLVDLNINYRTSNNDIAYSEDKDNTGAKFIYQPDKIDG